MYSDPIFSIGSFSPNLYGIFISIGLIMSLTAFDILCNSRKVPEKVNRFFYFLVIASVGFGFLGAILFQSFYDWIDSGFKVFALGGMTFLGGLIFGAISFLSVSLIMVRRNALFKKWTPTVLQIAPICVLVAHAFGRIGCFFAGCCHGSSAAHSIFGVDFLRTFRGLGNITVVYPTQLFEVIFNLTLASIMIFFLLKGFRWSNVAIYFIGYGTFRFFIEFIRGDISRGKLIGDTFSPSQIQSIILIVIGISLLVILHFLRTRKLASLDEGKNGSHGDPLDPKIATL